MFANHADRLFILFTVGLGLLLIAAANLSLRRRGLRVQVLATTLLVAVVLGGFAWWQEDLRAVGRLALLLGGGVLLGAVLSSPYGLLCSRVVQWLTRPVVCWLGLGLVGFSTLFGSIVLYETADAEGIALANFAFQRHAYQPPIRPAAAWAFTDLGTEIPLWSAAVPRSGAEAEEAERAYLVDAPFHDQLMRSGTAHDHANCHGWVFTGGRYWLSGEDVEAILVENGYQTVSSPLPGDLVVYREEDTVSHTAVVRYVTAGMPVLVEGKWGPFGTYVHPVERSSFGTNFTYYRSRRDGHLLQGMDETTAE